MSDFDKFPVVAVADVAEWSAWLAEHHATSTGAIVKVVTNWSEDPSVFSGWLVDEESMCWNWRTSIAFRTTLQAALRDPHVLAQPGLPPGHTLERVRHLIALESAGRLGPPAIALLEDLRSSGVVGRLEEAERGVQPPDLRAALEAVPRALSLWDEWLKDGERRDVLVGLANARDDERAQRIEQIVRTHDTNNLRPWM